MARLYDRIMSNGVAFLTSPPLITSEGLVAMQEALTFAQVIDATSVASYFFEQVDYARKKWLVSDFPNVAPPFPAYFVEYPVSPRWSMPKNGDRIGALIYSVKDAEGQAIGEPLWCCVCNVFVGLRDHGLKPLCLAAYTYFVDNDGQIREFADGRFLAAPYSDSFRESDGTVKQRVVSGMAHDCLYPALLTTAFLHCKNVRAVINEPRMPRPERRRGERPWAKYYTLEIDPMKEVLRREGRSEEVGLQKALHICRGHFADYTEKGLFGKYRGVFWFDSHVRGTASQGIIVKDYAVKAGQSPTSGRPADVGC